MRDRRPALAVTAWALAAAILLTGCTTRFLTRDERAFLATTHGAGLDSSRIEITRGAIIGEIPHSRPARPAVACRERIWPPETGTVTGQVAGVTLGNRIMVARWYHQPDLLDGYPDVLPLARAMFLAHEATHVWQWQQRDKTGYAPWRAAAEHGVSDDPYLFEVDGTQKFLDYGFEQQASLVEEYVCCRALDPEGARTERLRAMLTPYFPDIPDADLAEKIRLPWDKAKTARICH